MMPLFQVESKVVHQIAPIITRWQEKIKKKLSRPGRGPNVVPVLRQGPKSAIDGVLGLKQIEKPRWIS